MTEPLFPCTSALQTPNPPFWTTKTVVPKFPQNGGSTPSLCLDKAVHAQGGAGGSEDLLSLKPGYAVGDCHARRVPGVHEAHFLS